jgi:hypothetical protein
MPETNVEINLRIPRVKNPVKDPSGYPIDNGSVRYLRRVTLPVLPKPGELLKLPTSAGLELEAEVVRANWDDAKEMFVVYAGYAKRSIPPEEYHALVEDPAWTMQPLL